MARVAELVSQKIALLTDAYNANAKTLITPFYNVVGYGAVGDGVADDTAAFESALAAGPTWVPPGKYRLTRKLTLSTMGQLYGMDQPHDLSVAYVTELVLDHTDIGVQFGLQGCVLSGFKLSRPQATTSDKATVSLANSSYGRVDNCSVITNDGIGILMQGNTGEACYFNELRDVVVSGSGVGVKYTGANCTVNHWTGGKAAILGTPGTGIWFADNTSGHVLNAVDIEGCTVGTGVVFDAGNNLLIGCHIENNLTGVAHNVGSNTLLYTSVGAGSGQTEEAGSALYLSNRFGRFEISGSYQTGARENSFKFGADAQSTGINGFLDLQTSDANSYGILNIFNKTVGTGLRNLAVYCRNSANSLVQMWGITNNTQDGVYTQTMGEVKIAKESVVPEGVSYSPAPTGSIALTRQYSSKWGTTDWHGELWLKERSDTLTTGFRCVQVASAGTTRPTLTANHAGYMFFDATLGKPIWWNGTAWKDATGTAV